MRRMFLVLILVLLLGAAAIAENHASAYDIALQMQSAIPEMRDIKSAPLDETPNRAIWTDARTDAKCALIVLEDASLAMDAALDRATRHTSVRIAEGCLLETDSDLSVENIDLYHRALADALGIEIGEVVPDYILNVNTKKFHKPDCYSVDEMKQSNKFSYAGGQEMLAQHGYEACGRCKP